jgi:hypothetical protein
MNKAFAVVWASGLVEVKDTVPKGAVCLADGPRPAVEKLMVATCRHGTGKSEGKLLAPGVVEAPNEAAAMDALMGHAEWLKRTSLPRGVRICPKVV